MHISLSFLVTALFWLSCEKYFCEFSSLAQALTYAYVIITTFCFLTALSV